MGKKASIFFAVLQGDKVLSKKLDSTLKQVDEYHYALFDSGNGRYYRINNSSALIWSCLVLGDTLCTLFRKLNEKLDAGIDSQVVEDTLAVLHHFERRELIRYRPTVNLEAEAEKHLRQRMREEKKSERAKWKSVKSSPKPVEVIPEGKYRDEKPGTDSRYAIISHRRSGTHFLWEVMRQNLGVGLVPGQCLWDIPKIHDLFSAKLLQRIKDRKSLYIMRDIRAVLVANYNYWKNGEKRYNLSEVFQKIPLSSYIRGDIPLDGVPDELRAEAEQLFSDPIEYWIRHTEWSKHVFTIRYEDLKSNEKHTVSKIANYLGIKFDPQDYKELIKLVGHLPQKGKISAWRDVFTDDDLRFIWSKVGQRMEELGYSEDITHACPESKSVETRNHIVPNNILGGDVESQIRFRMGRFFAPAALPGDEWVSRVPAGHHFLQFEHGELRSVSGPEQRGIHRLGKFKEMLEKLKIPKSPFSLEFSCGDAAAQHEVNPIHGHFRVTGSDATILWPLAGYTDINSKIFGKNVGKHDCSWDEKIEIAVWRGTSSGTSWQNKTIDQIEECINRALSATDRFGGKVLAKGNRLTLVSRYYDAKFVDVGLSKTGQTDGIAKAYFTKRNFLKSRLSDSELLRYKYQIVVDGNTFASQLPWTLHCASVILMVPPSWESIIAGIRPWQHFVPLAPDYSDLEEKVDWCRAHDTECQEISAAATRLMRCYYDPQTEQQIQQGLLEPYTQNYLSI